MGLTISYSYDDEHTFSDYGDLTRAVCDCAVLLMVQLFGISTLILPLNPYMGIVDERSPSAYLRYGVALR